MRHVVLVAPHFLENTLRYVRAFLALEGARVSLVSDDPAERLPLDVRARLAGHFRVQNSLDPAEIARGTAALAEGVGRVERLVGVLEQLQLPLARARDALDLPGLRTEAALRFRDKDAMKAALRAAGVPVARSRLVHSLEELGEFTREVGFPVVVKPQAGLGARSTQRIESEAALAALGTDPAQAGLVPRADHPLQVEEFVRGREFTCETVSIEGTPVWRSGTRYYPTPLEVLENPWMQYCVLLPREADDPQFVAFHAINGRALAALGPGTNLTHMEWFLRDDGSMLVSEVGARPPGVMIMPLMSLAHEADLVAKWAELMVFDRFTPLERRHAAGAAFFRGQGSGRRVVAVHGAEAGIAQAGSALVELQLPEVGQPRAEGYEGEGWAIVRASTTERARHALHALVHHVRVELG